MAENFLSQKEVDVLLRGVAGDADEITEPAQETGVRPYDLATQERILRGRMLLDEVMKMHASDGLIILIQQILIGLAIGFTMKLMFSAVELAGELVVLTMGLSFANFFDPNSQSEASSVSQLFGSLALMVFVSSSLHLTLLASLDDSFTTLPISATPIGTGPFKVVAMMGRRMMAVGLQLVLPIIAALRVTNLALGMLTKAAPQLNLFGIGFPITLAAGFLMIGLVLPYLAQPLLAAMEYAIETTIKLPLIGMQPGLSTR